MLHSLCTASWLCIIALQGAALKYMRCKGVRPEVLVNAAHGVACEDMSCGFNTM